MDKFSLNKMVLESVDQYIAEKKPVASAQTVALYKEMMHNLLIMQNNDDDKYVEISLATESVLFYVSD
jgi:hypothetical protein